MNDPLRPVRFLVGRAGFVMVAMFYLLLFLEVAAAAVVAILMNRTVDESVRLFAAHRPALVNPSAIDHVDSAMQ